MTMSHLGSYKKSKLLELQEISTISVFPSAMTIRVLLYRLTLQEEMASLIAGIGMFLQDIFGKLRLEIILQKQKSYYCTKIHLPQCIRDL